MTRVPQRERSNVDEAGANADAAVYPDPRMPCF